MQYIDMDGKEPISIFILIGLIGLTALGLTGCRGELPEEYMEPLPSTTSDYQYEHDMDEYNSEEYIKRTNCYAYALDIVNNPLTGEDFKKSGADWAAQPGMFSGIQSAVGDTIGKMVMEHGHVSEVGEKPN